MAGQPLYLRVNQSHGIDQSKCMVVDCTTSSHQSPYTGHGAFQFFFWGNQYSAKVFVVSAELDG
jgi:hypothetical protein